MVCVLFQTRYNKKKRGPYKEAIRQATSEARKESLDPLQDIDAVLWSTPIQVNP